MQVIGLTGGMAAGKSTVASLFRQAHIPVFDADAVVRKLQGPRGRAFPFIAQHFPKAVKNNQLDRTVLREEVLSRPEALGILEKIIHPLVRQERELFLRRCRARGKRECVLDIPLLMEINADQECDWVVVVEAPYSTRLARIRQRGKGNVRMSEKQAQGFLKRQMSDEERRRRADFVIKTGLSKANTVKQVARFLHHIREIA
ncbi:dephospho-CoA kinase [Swingsia samuiensis]|uniref:Dephospho-CoA kinase n=1 Tax=Swingsia samuiensis TaxID=1293412 RepID=A0A4Y6UJ48_9PROT|nr:dephospho-CoA kinase [Swingsia samuiensis]QDH17633.1 dephospho-CoA kinase [Swingsia samuiensis]